MSNFSRISQAQKRQEPLVYANPFCQSEIFLAVWTFPFFLLLLTTATIPPTTAVSPSPVAHSLLCPSPFFFLAFVASSHCPEEKYANLGWGQQIWEETERADLTFQPRNLCDRIKQKATETQIAAICSIIIALTDFTA